MPRIPPSEIAAILKRNLDAVRKRIAAACSRANRSPEEVTLVAVTKYVDASITQSLVDNGQRDLAESRPQELWKKAAEVEANWHLVGHLQTNKVRRTLPLVALIHSIDRWELAAEISNEAVKQGRTIRGLLEVKLTAEEAKHGFEPHELRSRWMELLQLPGLVLEGLMGMAALDADEASCRAAFQSLRSLRDILKTPDHPLPILSMGMSSDFDVAVEEGATQVRVGSALFEGLH
jgi:PLP dependent protein